MRNLRDIFITPLSEEITPAWNRYSEGLQDNGEDSFEISLWFAHNFPERITEYKSIPKDWTWLDLEEILYNKTWSGEWLKCSQECIHEILSEFAQRSCGDYDNIVKIWHQVF